MRVAAVLLALGILALPGCSPDSEPQIGGGGDNCCAIAPRAKCRAALLKQGVTMEEADIVMGPPENICPSDSLSADRLRHISSVWRQECVGEAQNILDALNRGVCSPPGLADAGAPALGIPTDTPETPACIAGLKARGLKENEMWVMLHTPAGICPNVGVDEARIREILAKDWEASGCRANKPTEMLHALESGACGGDAG